MGTWNYRVVKRKDGSIGVHEVFYNEKGEAWAMTVEPVFKFVAFPNEDPDLNEDEHDVVEAIRILHHDVMKHPLFEEPDKWADQFPEDHETDEAEIEIMEELNIRQD